MAGLVFCLILFAFAVGAFCGWLATREKKPGIGTSRREAGATSRPILVYPGPAESPRFWSKTMRSRDALRRAEREMKAPTFEEGA